MCIYGFFLELCIFIKFQLLEFVCNLFKLLFVDYMKIFATMKGRKQCCPIGFLFQNGVDVVGYLTVRQ